MVPYTEKGLSTGWIDQNGGGFMSEPFYVSRGEVTRVDGLHRRARIAAGTEFDMGVHGAIKEHYRLDAEDLPLPVDYIAAATGG